MASTSAVVYVRPTVRGPTGSGAVVYVSHRQVAGLFTTNLGSSGLKKNWKPHAGVPFVDSQGHITPEWNRFLTFLANAKLGGAIYPTLPDVANFVTQQQVDAQFAQAIDQFTSALAQSVAQMQEVVKAAGLTGAASLPPVPLARQETNPQPISPAFTGAGEGGGGD